MKNKKLHINQGSHGDYPKPDVPADVAWKQMHDILLKHDLTTKPETKRRRRFLFFLLMAAVTVAGFAVWYFSGNADKPGKHQLTATPFDSANRKITDGQDLATG